MLLWYSVTLFISAFLLFLVQPMVGKMVLPLYGGVPAVWNTCMVFFQATLLMGYLYAHVSVKWLGTRRQSILHMILLFIPLAVLPILISYDASPPDEANPVFWLFGRLLVTVGLPLFIVSTSAPLLQRWFASSGLPSARDPYFLYASSNSGSLLALLGYPVIFEPLMSLTEQSLTWTYMYGLLIFFILLCGLFLWRSHASKDSSDMSTYSSDETSQYTQPSLRLRLFWISASFLPSSLLLGTTAHITTNLASIPLLWIVPLSLYLLSFILVFARNKLLPHTLMVRLMPLLIIPFSPLFFFSLYKEWMSIPLHMCMFFIVAMVCHGELAKKRPAAHHLTEFYLLIAFGGMLGGIFNAMIAPAIFNHIIEYPLVMVLACLLLPARQLESTTSRQRWLDLVIPLTLACITYGIFTVLKALEIDMHMIGSVLLFVMGVVCFSFKNRPIRFSLSYGVIIISIAFFFGQSGGKILHITRNFFGVKRVVVNQKDNTHLLFHGTIVHGAQSLDPDKKNQPMSYFHRTGPLGDVFAVFSKADGPSPVGIIGLGTGSIAAYAGEGHHFVYYEIDPDVEEIARESRFFTFLRDSQGSYEIVLGDGRLTMANAADNSYGMVILDAFSSDSIPVHLLTREAVQLYISKLKEDGMLVLHISNRFLNLEPLTGNLARELGLACLVRRDLSLTEEEQKSGRSPSLYVTMGQPDSMITHLTNYEGWEEIPESPGMPTWTDQFSNIISLLKW